MVIGEKVEGIKMDEDHLIHSAEVTVNIYSVFVFLKSESCDVSIAKTLFALRLISEDNSLAPPSSDPNIIQTRNVWNSLIFSVWNT